MTQYVCEVDAYSLLCVMAKIKLKWQSQRQQVQKLNVPKMIESNVSLYSGARAVFSATAWPSALEQYMLRRLQRFHSLSLTSLLLKDKMYTDS